MLEPKIATPPRSKQNASIKKPKTRLVGIFLAILALGLTAQVLYFSRHALLAQAPVKAVTTLVCRLVECQAPTSGLIQGIEITRHALHVGELVSVIEGQVVNKRSVEISAPNLLLRLRDQHGQPFAETVLTPAEYLDSRTGRIPPRSAKPIKVSFDTPEQRLWGYDLRIIAKQ